MSEIGIAMNPIVGASAITSLSFARRRRQARLRQSLHEIEKDCSDTTEETWITLTERSRISCHSGFELVSKRREANARERLRVRNLNSGFAKLRRILPTVPPNRKPSKVDTLQGAIDYIYQLERVLEATGGIPNIKKIMATTHHSHSRQSVTERPFFDDSTTDATHAITMRYAPPFNRCEATGYHARFKEKAQNYPRVGYLTIPPVSNYLADGRLAYSNGYASTPSPVEAEEFPQFTRDFDELGSDRLSNSPTYISTTYSTREDVNCSWRERTKNYSSTESNENKESNDSRIREGNVNINLIPRKAEVYMSLSKVCSRQ